jgi:two-component system, LuxR family, response regulator FixJ
MAEIAKIAIVDDDWAMREAIKTLVETVGLSAEGFSSAEEFLSSQYARDSQCLILDVRMPGMSGLELQRRLVETYRDMPVILITAHGDEERRARALKGGAVEYLLKPFSEESLLGAVRTALSEK